MDEKLVTENMGLIYLAIKQLHLNYKTDDEFQEYYDAGLEGLIKGAKKYDSETGFKQSTFLLVCIKNEIKKELYSKTMPKRFNPNGSDLSLDYNFISDDEQSFEDFIPDPNVNVELEVEKKIEVERLIQALNSLKNEKDKEAIKLYYGLDGYQECGTCEKVAKIMGVTRNAVWLRIKRGQEKLKKILNNSKEVFVVNQKDNTQLDKHETKKANALVELNNILFAQLNELNSSKGEEFDKSVRKSFVVAQLAQQITNNANTMLKAVKLASEDNTNKNALKMIGIDDV